jgi:hypothetical protein
MKPIFSRRHLLGSAAGMGIAGAAAVALPSSVSAAPGSPLTPSAAAPALQHLSIPGFDFYPYRSTDTGYNFNHGNWPTGGTSFFLRTGIRLPDGSVLRELQLFARNADSLPMGYVLERTSLASGSISFVNLLNGTIPVGATTGATAALSHVVDNTAYSYNLQVSFTSATGLQEIYGARVTYEPTLAVTALNPTVRVLDTRSGSKLANAQELTVDLSGLIPAGARFAICTITLDQTEQSGYLAAFPADTAWPGNSNVNWAVDGESVANTVVAPLSEARQFKIRVGGGRTHVIIDVTGGVA